ncbi:MAG: hypothetical protein PHE48_02570 [Candidatus Daviesbacteria bacterium]|nr:hypothetical protein [Candidatus Daviesbacteria bacterium]
MKRKITNKNLIVLLGLLRRFNKDPEPRFCRQARERLLEKISPRKRFWLLPSINSHPLIWRRLTAASFKYGLSIFLCFVLLGASTALAAQSSLPASPLYPIKKATEQVFLTVSKVFSQQTQIEQKITNERFKEVQKLEELIEETAKEYHNNVEKFERIDPQFKKEAREQVVRQKAILEKNSAKKEEQNETKLNNQDNILNNATEVQPVKEERVVTKEKEAPVSNDTKQQKNSEEKKQDNPQPQKNEDKSSKDHKK